MKDEYRRPIGQCAKCGKVEALAADHICYRCYRARARKRDRAEQAATFRWAEVPAERHNHGLLKEQKRLRKAVVDMLNALDDAGELFAEEDRVFFRRRLQPYMERMARSLAARAPAGPESSQEPPSDDREREADVNSSQ